MANLKLSTNNILLIVFLILAVVCIYVFVSGSGVDKTGFQDVSPLQQYINSYPYNPNFANFMQKIFMLFANKRNQQPTKQATRALT